MKPRPIPVLALTLLLFLAATPAREGRGVAAADLSAPPLSRTLSLDLWGVSLSDAAKAIAEQTGVEVVFYLADFTAEKNAKSVFLETGQVSLRTVMECLARRYGFRYRLGESGRVEVSKGYAWVPADDYAVRFLRVDPLLSPDGDLEALRAFLGEFVKPLPLLGGDFSLALARSPAPDNRNAARAEAVLPPVLADYFDKAVKCLSGENGDHPPPPGRVRPAIFATASFPPRLDWESLLNRDFSVPRADNARSALKSICMQAGIAVILEAPPPSGMGRPFVDMAVERAALGKLTAELASRLGLNRRVFLDAGGLAFEAAPKDEWENDHRSREFFWTGLGVAGFAARTAADICGGGSALAKRLRSEVFPALWRDPVTAVGYCPATGRLAVIAPMNVIEAVARKLEGIAAMRN